MDPITAKLMAAAGAAKEATYVDDVFSTFLHEGTGSAQTITNGIDISGEGGMVIIKNRPRSIDGFFTFDTERGTNKYIRTNLANAEQTSTSILTAFSSTGFSIGTSGSSNRSGDGYVSWTFRKCPGFFDIVTYTGNGVEDSNGLRTISHNLGAKIGFIAIKNLSTSSDWVCAHTDLQYPYYLELNTNQGSQGGSVSASPGYIYLPNNTTNFQIGNGGSASAGLDLNINNNNYVAYIWALGTDSDSQVFGDDGDEAIIKCGSYTGNGTSSNSVTLGFEPQWLLVKDSSSTNNWGLYDTMRGITTGGNDPYLMPDIAQYEDGDFNLYSVTPTGFEAVSSNQFVNGNSQTYIYIAIRRPHKPPNAATDVFSPAATSASTGTKITTGFPVDLQITKYNRSAVTAPWVFTRLTKVSTTSAELGEAYLATANANGENNATTLTRNWGNTGFEVPSLWGGDSSIYWNFRRAPGFFDVVTYTGNSTNFRDVSHNLSVTPEMIWVKNRSTNRDWIVWHKDFSSAADSYANLNLNSAVGSSTDMWGDGLHTSTTFELGLQNSVNRSGDDLIAYLFASRAGISKVGTYAGTGSDIDVDCGFTNGARFVMIKRTDASADWFVVDTARGIASGNDPYLTLNTTEGEGTTANVIDPLSSGFTVKTSGGAAINGSGGTYLFLAIA